MTAKTKKEIAGYLKAIQTYSALVEAKLNEADPGGVGTTRKQQKNLDKADAIRRKFHK